MEHLPCPFYGGLELEIIEELSGSVQATWVTGLRSTVNAAHKGQ